MIIITDATITQRIKQFSHVGAKENNHAKNNSMNTEETIGGLTKDCRRTW